MKYLKYLLFIVLLIPHSVSASTSAVVDITSMSIADIKEALDKGYLTSELLVTLYLERIEAYDKDFNSIQSLNENALAEAKTLDAERASGNIHGALHGIPILVKSNIDVEGIPTTAGAKALANNYPVDDAAVVQRLKEAGAIILGSTNMSEFAFKASNSKSSYGTVGNAFNPDYSPYGSSGGSAVSIALSFAAASLGTDTNSSVRAPAAAAGLVGLRPTFDLIDTDGVIPYDVLRDTVGVLTKTVTDNALILDVIASSKPEKTTDLSNIKIGVIKGYLEGSPKGSSVNGKTDSDIADLAKEKITLLENNGFEIVYIDKLVNNYYLSIANNTMTGGSFCDGYDAYTKKNYSNSTLKKLTYTSGHIYSLSGYLSFCNNNWQKNLKTVNRRKATFENHILDIMDEY
ncbi:MAG: amidase, partial [Bacilli bacterium]|nr:amidase [Bacilli bacterium]